MTNPLIAKWEELHNPKKEPPKKVEDEPSFKEKLKELRDTSTISITKLTSYDNETLNDSFLQIAEKVKNKQAQISSMNIDIDQQTRTQRITFEVWDTF
jgi:hypothetical protein